MDEVWGLDTAMSTRNYRPDMPPIIVRSFGNEPVALVAHGVDRAKRRVLVGLEHATRPISLPFADVCDYDAERFIELKAAFESGDQRRLDDLYNQLGQNNACNRYQDMLPLEHEKEPEITNTRR